MRIATRNFPASHRRLSSAAGYTLVEMLFVVGLMIIFLVIAANGTKKTWETQEIKASAFHLAHDITLASQTAQKLNRIVTILFYKGHSTDIAGAPNGSWHTYQMFVYDPQPKSSSGSTPSSSTASNNQSSDPDLKALFEVQSFEGTTLISDDFNRYSTLFAVLNRYKSGESEFASLEFKPDGSTTLPSPPPDHLGPLTITLIPARYADPDFQTSHPNDTPKAFASLVIHPENGTVTVY